MSAITTPNWQGGVRIDAPLLRLIDSFVRGDFDLLAGSIISGGRPLVVRGFTLATTQLGVRPETLAVVVEGGVALHPGASVSGTIFRVPGGRTVETLSSSNPRVLGSFGASRANYVGLDITRAPDASTSDRLTFWEPALGTEQQRSTPLAQSQDYVLVVTDLPFEQVPTLLPLWIVETDASGAVSALRDARPLLSALSSGGSAPDLSYGYPWPEGRSPIDPSRGGDKAIFSVKDDLDAVKSRIREIGGGQYWYSAVSDRNVKMARSGTTFANGEYFEWDGGDLHWRGLSFVLPNSAGLRNEVADQTTDVTGLTNLGDNECIYVDVDFSANKTGGSALVPVRAPLQNLGYSDRGKCRTVIAWRSGGGAVFVRDSGFAVGSEPFPSIRSVADSEPLFRRVRADCIGSPTIIIQPWGSFQLVVSGQPTTFTVDSPVTLSAATAAGGSLAANTLYYLYIWYDTGALTLKYEASTTAFDDQKKYKSLDSTRRFLLAFSTNSANQVEIFKYSWGQMQYLNQPINNTELRLLSGGSSTSPIAVPYNHLVPDGHEKACLAAVGSTTTSNFLAVEPRGYGPRHRMYVNTSSTNSWHGEVPRGLSNEFDYYWNTTTGSASIYCLGYYL